jgi:hypothetical protein
MDGANPHTLAPRIERGSLATSNLDSLLSHIVQAELQQELKLALDGLLLDFAVERFKFRA